MDTDLARDLAHRGGVDALRHMTRSAAGGVVHDEGGVTLFAGPHALPYLLNSVVREDPSVHPAEVLARGRDFFTPRQRGFTVMGLRGVDDDLVAFAAEAGLGTIGDDSPLMAIDGPPAHIDVPDGGRIDRVTTAADVAAVADVCSDAYAVYGMPSDVAIAVHESPEVLLAPHVAAVLAYDDDGPVATASVVATHGTAYVQWVGTRQRAFGRGYGAAVTQAITAAGFELGARLATLGASPMGAPVYRRLGWVEIGSTVSRIAFTALP